MFLDLILRRQFHVGSGFWSAQTSMLAALRKKTGYTFANCKKALEIHNNDVIKAEAWLKEQAQFMGWTKATKLRARKATKGLVGVLNKPNVAAMVELNCETDFVAKNEIFLEMLDIVVNACVQKAGDHELYNSLVQLHLDTNDLKSLRVPDGKTLADHLAMMVGKVGENAVLRRALVYKADESVYLSAYAHPSRIATGATLMGKFGGLLAITKTPEASDDLDLSRMGQKLCQHIVGMHPMKLGTPDDVPALDVEEEKCLIHQEYLFDDSFTVGEVLDEHGLKILGFKRFECGEESPTAQLLENIETCQ